MTQPPQGPPDPYGQQGPQPGQWGNPGQPQQAGWGQPDPWAQQGQWGQGQQGQWGQPYPGQQGQPDPYQAGYPQGYPGAHPGQPGFGQPGFGPQGPGGQPPKSKTGLIVGLSLAGVAVVGGAVTLILLLTGGDDQAEVENLADRTARAIEDQDTAAAREVSCPSNAGEVEATPDEMPGDFSFSAERVGQVTVNDDTAEFDIELTIDMGGSLPNNAGGPQSTTMTLEAAKEDGDWCVKGSKS